jgi:hypothetical protein
MDTTGGSPKSKYIMGRRNWCAVDWDPASGDLVFDIRVEKEKGYGHTVGYVIPASGLRRRSLKRITDIRYERRPLAGAEMRRVMQHMLETMAMG